MPPNNCLGDIALTQNIVPVLPEDWLTAIGDEFKAYIRDLKTFLVKERTQHTVSQGQRCSPPFGHAVFKGSRSDSWSGTPIMDLIKPTVSAFCTAWTATTTSLQNIFKELNRDPEYLCPATAI